MAFRFAGLMFAEVRSLVPCAGHVLKPSSVLCVSWPRVEPPPPPQYVEWLKKLCAAGCLKER